MDIKEIGWLLGFDSGDGQVTGSYKHGDETSGSIK
jgi:hypothetical protein